MPINPFATRVGELLREMKAKHGKSKDRAEASRRFTDAAHQAKKDLGLVSRKIESPVREAKKAMKRRTFSKKQRAAQKRFAAMARSRGKHSRRGRGSRRAFVATTRSVPGVVLFGGFSTDLYPDQSVSYLSGARTGGVTNTGSFQGLSAKLPSGSAFVKTAVSMNGLKKQLIETGMV